MERRPPPPDQPPPGWRGPSSRPLGGPGGYGNQGRHRPAPPREPPPAYLSGGSGNDDQERHRYPPPHGSDFRRGDSFGRGFNNNPRDFGGGDRRNERGPYSQQGPPYRGSAPHQGDSIHGHRTHQGGYQNMLQSNPGQRPYDGPFPRNERFMHPYDRSGYQNDRSSGSRYGSSSGHFGGPGRVGASLPRKNAPPPPQGAPPLYRLRSDGTRPPYAANRSENDRIPIQRSSSAPLISNKANEWDSEIQSSEAVEEGEVLMTHREEHYSDEIQIEEHGEVKHISHADGIKLEKERPGDESVLGSSDTLKVEMSKENPPKETGTRPAVFDFGSTMKKNVKGDIEDKPEDTEQSRKRLQEVKKAKRNKSIPDKEDEDVEDESAKAPSRKRAKDVAHLDTSLPVEDMDIDSVNNYEKKNKTRHQKTKRSLSKTDDDVDVENEASDSSTPRLKKKKKKKKTTRQEEDVEAEEETLSKDEDDVSDVKVRRKYRLGTEEATTNSVQGRAAKKRAAELIAKPKTPSSAAASTGLNAAENKLELVKRNAARQTSGERIAGAAGKKRLSVLDDASEIPSPADLASPSPPLNASPLNTGVISAELVEQWWECLREQYNEQYNEIMSKPVDAFSPPPKVVAISQRELSKKPVEPRQVATAIFYQPQDAPGYAERELWAQDHWSELRSLLSASMTLERNKALLGAQEYAYRSRLFRELKEQQKLIAEAQAQPQKHRYPSRNNPAAVAMELGTLHGVAEQERREKERRKNAAVTPGMEPRDLYLASVFARRQFLTLDGQPARCETLTECLAPNSPIPGDLIVPSPLGCNCARAVAEATQAPHWTDVEKALFLDKFLQYPKDFQRIASFLRNKTTEDCIAFYYDSKKRCDYKHYLAEHSRRRHKEPGELTHVRETYLAKLGVKLPLMPEADAYSTIAASRDSSDAIEEIRAEKGPFVIFSGVDIYPKLPGHNHASGTYLRPAWICEDPECKTVPMSDLVGWLAPVS